MFRIKIQEVVATQVQRQEYQKLAETGNKGDGGPVFGYVAIPGHFTTSERDMLIQEVDSLDLAAVIRAINGL